MAIYHTAHATYQLDVSLVSQNQAGNYSTVNIHLYAYADSGWGSGTFASGIGFSVSAWGNGSSNINGTVWDILNINVNVGHDAAGNYGTYVVSSHTNATGTATYGGPVDLSQGVALPRIPKVPQAPLISATAKPGLKVDVNVSFPAGYDEGGTSVQYLWTEYSKDGGAFTGGQSGGWGVRTYNNLLPGSYVFRARAHNAIGDSPNTTAAAVQVLPGGYVWNGTAWVASLGVYTWNGTAWVIALGVYTWNGSSWVISL